jgi:putative transposase
LERKLELVRRHREEYGLNRCLAALGVSKSTWHRHRQPKVSREDKELKAKVLKVVEEHPAYGYRRIKVELAERHGMVVNHKRLRRLLSEWDLALKRRVARPKPSGVREILKEAEGRLNLLLNRKPQPFEVLCTDFTGVRYAGGGRKAYLMAMVDPASGWVAGWAVGARADRKLALRCWEAVKEGLAKVGRGPQGLIVHHDQDSVYTSYLWLRKLLIEDKVVVSYCERGAKDNPWMESFWAHFKGENASLFLETASLEELEWVIGRQMEYYNFERRHSSLGYRSPVEYLVSEGFIPESLAENWVKSGSASGAQVRTTKGSLGAIKPRAPPKKSIVLT